MASKDLKNSEELKSPTGDDLQPTDNLLPSEPAGLTFDDESPESAEVIKAAEEITEVPEPELTVENTEVSVEELPVPDPEETEEVETCWPGGNPPDVKKGVGRIICPPPSVFTS